MSDHMNEAVNYIKHLEKKFKDLDAKRHELKRVSDLASVGSRTKPAAASISHHCFIIRPCLIGIEIMFRCGVEDQDLSSSRVLAVLVDEGLHVVSCFSTKSEEFLFHSTIQTEVNDPTSVNISRMQQKLPQSSEDCTASSYKTQNESVKGSNLVGKVNGVYRYIYIYFISNLNNGLMCGAASQAN
ncbi:hypothetical protein E1A91_D08G223000v1 [Gossypium mustelinum]|uniref:BHLH domain-containing protein n=1 Tax=Gossypium mustelinum TaxID=34275 RepID=A0A5D2TYV2_GOSMU|nr:hypothetical protein E1A91_D08G223000v1 [Gossypium mustelinum]